MTARILMATVAACLLSVLLWNPQALAHHSTAIYDSENPIELAGTVVEWKFTNPHCIVAIEVTAANGEKQIWNLEGSNTSLLFRRGWNPETLKPGDNILATVRPLRSGVFGGNYSNLRWEDGTVIDPKGQ